MLENPAMKKIKFTLKTNGFDFQNFATLNGLSIFGNVHQKSEALRFLISKNTNLLSSAWHNLKQDIENGFEMNCTFKFRRGINSIALSGS